MHGVDRAGGVALQRLDLPGDLFRRVLGLHRERLHLGGDDREAAPGLAGARGLDGGVEREQRGLPGDLRDQVDDIADRRRGFAQAVDIGAGFAGGGAGLVGELAGVAHLRADALRRLGELVGGVRKGGVAVPCAALVRPVRASVRWRMVGQRGRGRLGAAGDRIGRALELADHGAEFEFQQFEDFLGRIALGAERSPVAAAAGFSCGCSGRARRFRHPLFEQTEGHEVS